jgi:hypothetical protein
VPNEHFSAVIERIDDDGASISEPNLENGLLVLFPPSFADSRMVITKLQEMANDWPSSWDFGNAADVGNIGCRGPLLESK